MNTPNTSAPSLSSAWIDGASEPADIYGDVTAECPHNDPRLAAAWAEGASEMRDWDGKATLSNNPYQQEQ
ncbi:hypothetical protein [Arthrobacter sp. zg-Y1110]|uniref:hypothetical protein n=1 Tax=Arthrobacter sp. zg-Y1110 TaxID=2886932 RepID=UPI001D13757E|nr:hypothetical protein [Arthrobacter sp. zg-Y1110]MCC3292904.1 hypothetical protein [Arthrobacter sp. zg-Y1110]UWX86843.1 hypothetical protein N2K99_18545 [Arthrobacter sp. zg-Y1110]